MASVIISMEEYQEYQLLKEERAGGKLDASSYKTKVEKSILMYLGGDHCLFDCFKMNGLDFKLNTYVGGRKPNLQLTEL